MAAPGQPGYPGPYQYRFPWYFFRILCFIGAVCEFIAALIFCGIASGPAMAWLAGGVSAFFLGWAVP